MKPTFRAIVVLLFARLTIPAVVIAAAACLGTTALAIETEALSQLRQQRSEAARRVRRVIFNNDGDDHLLDGPASVEAFLAKRTTPLLDSQVDTIVYCTSRPFGMFTHNTKVGDVLTTKVGFAGNRNNIVGDLVAQGTDPLRIMVDYGHKNRKEVFWSMRMNDTHDAAHPPDKPQYYWSTFKEQHRDWLFGSWTKRPAHGAWSGVDFAEPTVRDFLFRVFEEICRNYDVDGIELDFFRHPVFFKTVANGGRATTKEVAMMTDLLRRVRAMTETEGLRRGRPILVAARVPDSVGYCRDMGLDLDACLRAKLIDLLVTTDYFRLNPWEHSIALGREYGVPVYPCLTDSRVKGESRFSRSANESYRGRAMNAWAAGGDGIYIFNCFNPRHSLWWDLGDPTKLRTMDKLYFVTVCDGSPDRYLANGRQHQTVPILTPGRSVSLSASQPWIVPVAVGDNLALAQQKGLKPALTCHLQIPGVSRVEQLRVKFNGHALADGEVNGGWVDMPLQPAWAKQGMNQLEVSVHAAEVASKSWDLECVCTEELSAPWVRGRGTSSTSTAMRDGALVIADKGTEQGSYLYYSYPWGADPARTAVVEATAKVVADKSAIIVANGVAEQEVRLYPDQITTRHAGLTYAMDTTDAFHTYRIEIQAQDIRVFVDGVLRLDGVGKFTHPASSARNAVLFGAASSNETGEASWRAIRLRSGSHLLNDVVLSVRYH
ncbi:MAG: hypothetical protein GXY83_22600 [Rhodopirellula sp.]|nr:hypothetical protein [Rhodopirellula sp.]